MRRIALLAAAVAAALAVSPIEAAPKPRTGGTGGPIPCNDGAVTWTPTTVWPPNHKMVTVDIYYDENEDDGDTLTVAVENISHDQILADGTELVGSGKPNDGADFTPGTPGTATDPDAAHTTAQVRSERSGTRREGRTYSITVRCTDSGHAGSDGEDGEEPESETVTITTKVPHDQGKR